MGDAPQAPKDTPIRMFSDWLQKTHRGGELDAEITAKLAEVTSAVDFLKKKGTLTISFEVKPGPNNADWMQVTDTVTAKPPVPDREVEIYWADSESGELVRHDPGNVRMFPDKSSE